jgi:hypothetical protein
MRDEVGCRRAVAASGLYAAAGAIYYAGSAATTAIIHKRLRYPKTRDPLYAATTAARTSSVRAFD